MKGHVSSIPIQDTLELLSLKPQEEEENYVEYYIRWTVLLNKGRPLKLKEGITQFYCGLKKTDFEKIDRVIGGCFLQLTFEEARDALFHTMINVNGLKQ